MNELTRTRKSLDALDEALGISSQNPEYDQFPTGEGSSCAPSGLLPDTPEIRAAEFVQSLETAMLDSSDMANLHIPPRTRLLGEFFHEGDLGFIYAPRGGGKTWMSMMMAGARANNDTLGIWTAGERPSRVLYVDGEMHSAGTQSRCRALNLRSKQLHWIHSDLLYEKTEQTLNLGLEEQQLAITELCVKHNIQEVYLDNLSSLVRGLKENDGDDWRELVLPWLLELRHLKITVVVVHHAGRNGLMRGTSQREDHANWIMKLSPASESESQGADFVSKFEKLRGNPRNCQSLRWTLKTRPDGTIDHQCVRFSDREALLVHIREGVGQATDLAELVGVSKGTVSKWAKQLADDERIVIERGTYRAI